MALEHVVAAREPDLRAVTVPEMALVFVHVIEIVYGRTFEMCDAQGVVAGIEVGVMLENGIEVAGDFGFESRWRLIG